MKKWLFAFICFATACAATACDFDEACEGTEAVMVSMSSGNGDYLIDKFEASRSGATSETQGTGVTLACDYQNTIPWEFVTYADARNACLDAGKRLCTKDEWIAACNGTAVESCTINAAESTLTGKATCKSSKGVYDMLGNMDEWVEGGLLMGGSYLSTDSASISCTTSRSVANYDVSSNAEKGVGFRCCQDVSTL